MSPKVEKLAIDGVQVDPYDIGYEAFGDESGSTVKFRLPAQHPSAGKKLEDEMRLEAGTFAIDMMVVSVGGTYPWQEVDFTLWAPQGGFPWHRVPASPPPPPESPPSPAQRAGGERLEDRLREDAFDIQNVLEAQPGPSVRPITVINDLLRPEDLRRAAAALEAVRRLGQPSFRKGPPYRTVCWYCEHFVHDGCAPDCPWSRLQRLLGESE